MAEQEFYIDVNFNGQTAKAIAAVIGSTNLLLQSDAGNGGKIYWGAAQNSAYDEANDRLGIGINAPAVKLHILSTATEQFRIGYDGSTYASFGISSTGQTTIGNTGGDIIFAPSGSFRINSGNFYMGATATSSNLFVQGTGTINSGSSVGSLQLNGSSNASYRIFMRGSGTATLTANYSYGSFVIGTQGFTIAATGTHPIAVQLGIKALSITAGAGTLSNSASLYIEGAATGATNNYAFWSAAGNNRFDGKVSFGLTTPTALVHIKAGTATAGSAPLKLTSGTNLTTAEDGAFEYNGTNLFFTVGSTRKTVTLT